MDEADLATVVELHVHVAAHWHVQLHCEATLKRCFSCASSFVLFACFSHLSVVSVCLCVVVCVCV